MYKQQREIRRLFKINTNVGGKNGHIFQPHLEIFVKTFCFQHRYSRLFDFNHWISRFGELRLSWITIFKLVLDFGNSEIGIPNFIFDTNYSFCVIISRLEMGSFEVNAVPDIYLEFSMKGGRYSSVRTPVIAFQVLLLN